MKPKKINCTFDGKQCEATPGDLGIALAEAELHQIQSCTILGVKEGSLSGNMNGKDKSDGIIISITVTTGIVENKGIEYLRGISGKLGKVSEIAHHNGDTISRFAPQFKDVLEKKQNRQTKVDFYDHALNDAKVSNTIIIRTFSFHGLSSYFDLVDLTFQEQPSFTNSGKNNSPTKGRGASPQTLAPRLRTSKAKPFEDFISLLNIHTNVPGRGCGSPPKPTRHPAFITLICFFYKLTRAARGSCGQTGLTIYRYMYRQENHGPGLHTITRGAFLKNRPPGNPPKNFPLALRAARLHNRIPNQ